MAKDPHSRLSDANVWCPDKGWSLHWYAHFLDYRKAEREIHRLLGPSRRLKGEWWLMSKTEAISIINSVGTSFGT